MGDAYACCAIITCLILHVFSSTLFAVPPQPVVSSSDPVNCTIAPSSIALECSWSTPSYYVGWYKDGSLIYSEDLSVPSVLTPASEGLFVISDYNDRSSNLTILSSSVADSGNYTCVVSCGARGVDFSNINSTLMDTVKVLVFGECYLSMVRPMFSWHITRALCTISSCHGIRSLSYRLRMSYMCVHEGRLLELMFCCTVG